MVIYAFKSWDDVNLLAKTLSISLHLEGKWKVAEKELI